MSRQTLATKVDPRERCSLEEQNVTSTLCYIPLLLVLNFITGILWNKIIPCLRVFCQGQPVPPNSLSASFVWTDPVAIPEQFGIPLAVNEYPNDELNTTFNKINILAFRYNITFVTILILFQILSLFYQ